MLTTHLPAISSSREEAIVRDKSDDSLDRSSLTPSQQKLHITTFNLEGSVEREEVLALSESDYITVEPILEEIKISYQCRMTLGDDCNSEEEIQGMGIHETMPEVPGFSEEERKHYFVMLNSAQLYINAKDVILSYNDIF